MVKVGGGVFYLVVGLGWSWLVLVIVLFRLCAWVKGVSVYRTPRFH